MYALEGTLGNYRQQGDAMVDFFNKLTKMWDELMNYVKVPNCCCGSPTCKRIADAERQYKGKMLHKFLIGLDYSFRTIISQILNMNPLLFINMHIIWLFVKNGIM